MTEKMAEFCGSVVKFHAWKESWVMTKGKREVKVGTCLLSNYGNRVTAKNALSYF